MPYATQRFISGEWDHVCPAATEETALARISRLKQQLAPQRLAVLYRREGSRTWTVIGSWRRDIVGDRPGEWRQM